MKISDTDDGARAPPFVTALARGLEVLASFTRDSPELGASEIARRIGLPQPTVWRLCQTLLAVGYLVPSASGQRMRLGPKVLGLGFAVIADDFIGEIARPYLQQIAEQYQGGTSLGMRVGRDILYLQRCIGGEVAFRDLRIGSRVAILESPMGWAHLAAISEGERDEFLSSGPRLSSRAAMHVARAVKRFEVDGFVAAVRAIHPDFNAVAVPVFSNDRRQILALSCGGLASTIKEKLIPEIGSKLKIVAAAIGSAIPPERQSRGNSGSDS